jgi:hypothetical protein
MSEPAPTPPPELPDEVVEALDRCSPELLRTAARHAEDLAEYREQAARVDSEDDQTDSSDDRPDGVPSKATITVKEINDNCYYYWQWRDGEKIRSKYEGPVNPSE